MEAEAHNPEQERLGKRRMYEVRQRMRGAGATGLPSELPPLEAIHAGVCPLCSFPTDALHRHFVVHFPRMNYADALNAFLAKLNLPEGTDLTSNAKREIQRAAQAQRMHGPEAEKIRANLTEKARGNRSHVAAVPYWSMMCAITRGATAEEAHEDLNLGERLTPHAVGRRARSLGYSYETKGRCDQSEPYRYERLFHLRRVTGFGVADLDLYIGLNGSSAATVPDDRIMTPSDAKKATLWRDGLLTKLLAVPLLMVAGKEYRKDDVLLTFLPEIAETNRALIASIGELRDELRKHREWTLEDFGEEVCRAAAREFSVEGNPDHSRRKTLRYLAEEKSVEWLKENLARLSSAELDGPLVRKLIGRRYGRTEQTVLNALRSRTDVIPPAEVCGLILKYAPEFAAEKKTIGAPEGRREKTEKHFQPAVDFSLCGYSKRAMSIYVYDDSPTPATAYTNTKILFLKFPTEIAALKKTTSLREARARVDAAIAKRGRKKSS